MPSGIRRLHRDPTTEAPQSSNDGGQLSLSEKLRQEQLSEQPPPRKRGPIMDDDRTPSIVRRHRPPSQVPPAHKRRLRMALGAFGDCVPRKDPGDAVSHSVEVSPSASWHRRLGAAALGATVLSLFVMGGKNSGVEIRLGDESKYNNTLDAVADMEEGDSNGDGLLSNLSLRRSSDEDAHASLDVDDKETTRNNSTDELPGHHTIHHAVFPSYFQHLSNLTDPYDARIETPYFWDVHFSGESVAESVFSRCYGLVLACEFGLRQNDYNEEKLEIFKLDGAKYVNVDTTSIEGIQRASQLGLAQSHLADIIISPYVHTITSDIFTSSNAGRMFALFRHPVDRALGMYYYLARASWDPMYNPSLAKMSIEEYARSKYIENNWITRFLVQKPRGKLLLSDLLLAKKIINFKCLVGMYDEMEASMARFQRYFGWNGDKSIDVRSKVSACRDGIVAGGDKMLEHPISVKDGRTEGVVRVGSNAWDAIARRNRFDIELYEYAKRTFRRQGEQIFDIV